MISEPFYNPDLSYEDNFNLGPFGAFADSHVFSQAGVAKHTLFGLPLHLPFGIPAGPLLNSRFVIAALDKGFDICVYKTVRTRAYPSHPHPNIVAVHPEGDLTLQRARQPLVGDADYSDSDIGITNSFGVPSPAVEFWQEDMALAAKHARVGQIVWGGFQATVGSGGESAYLDDWRLGARLVKQTGVPAMVANLSCPNEGSSHMLCFDLARAEKVANTIKEEVGNTPVLLKLAYFEDQEQLRKLVNTVGGVVDGLIAINTIPAAVVDAKGNQALTGEGRAVSGICGSPIRWAGLEMVQRLKELRREMEMEFVIVGVGGVTRPEHYHAYRKHGADVVLSATGAMWNPNLAKEIKEQDGQ